MRVNLPKIYKNKIDEQIRNSQDTYYSREASKSDFLNNLPMDAVIETKNRLWQAKIVGKTENYLVTNTGEVINLNECIKIRKL